MKFFFTLFMISLFTYSSLHAEVMFDGTLGAGVTLDGPNYDISAEWGQQHGGNLFHSFQTFNLNAQETAIFSGPNSINSIISRVTGGYPSSIDGTLRSTIPDADVYFINPAGIMFGPNATLDVQGSFHASTADTLRLQDGGQFNAQNPQDSLLSVAPVSAFGFLTEFPQPLSIDGSTLTTPIGKTLSMVGGDIQVNKTFLTAISGRINLAGVAKTGNVALLPEDLALSTSAADITLQESIMTVSGGGGGIYIRAGQFLLDNTAVQANTYNTTHGGEINVQANNLTATQGSRFISNTFGSGQGGQIKINVEGVTTFSGEHIQQLINPSGIMTNSRQEGEAGIIELKTGTLNIEAGATINATVYGQGHGGDINIHATDSIKLSGVSSSQNQGSSIATNTRGKMANAGKGGTITLGAKELQVADGAQIGTTTFGSGQGGKVNLKIAERVTFSGEDQRGISSGILALTRNTGSAGTIELDTNQLLLREGARISTESTGSGQGGNINIQARNLVRLESINSAGEGSFITANASGEIDNAGDGGTITLTAGRLQLTDGAQIGTATYGIGQGGILNINVAGDVNFSGEDKTGFRSGLFTSSELGAIGNAGTIRLNAGNLSLADKAEINVSTLGSGLGGNVEIQAGTLTLTEDSTITAMSQNQGNAGHLVLKIEDKLEMRNSTITTQAKSADGGNLTITTPSYLSLVNSQLAPVLMKILVAGAILI